MANEIRIRSNNQSGTITNAPLLVAGTSITSAEFVDLPEVTGTQHLMIILDPLETGGPAEIVQVTAHTPASDTVTVTRAQEGSSARQHALGTTWHHGPVGSDYNYTQREALSTNRPATPFEGEMIYETDTDRLGIYDGTEWRRKNLKYIDSGVEEVVYVATSAVSGTINYNVTFETAPEVVGSIQVGANLDILVNWSAVPGVSSVSYRTFQRGLGNVSGTARIYWMAIGDLA